MFLRFICAPKIVQDICFDGIINPHDAMTTIQTLQCTFGDCSLTEFTMLSFVRIRTITRWTIITEESTTTSRATLDFRKQARETKHHGKENKRQNNLRIFRITIPTIDTKDFFIVDITTTGIQILCFAVFATVSCSVDGTVRFTTITKVLRIMESIFQSRNAFPAMVTFMIIVTGIEFLITFDPRPTLFC